MKSIIAAIFILQALTGCEPRKEITEIESRGPDTIRDTIYIHERDTLPARDETPGQQETVDERVIIVSSQFLDNPFLDGMPSVERLRARYADFQVWELEEVENRHIPGQIDSLYIIHAGGSSFRIYYVNKKSLLERAEIRSDRVRMSRNIRVGMGRQQFMQAFPEIDVPLSNNAIVEVQHGLVDQVYMVFRFSNGRLTQATYYGYVD